MPLLSRTSLLLASGLVGGLIAGVGPALAQDRIAIQPGANATVSNVSAPRDGVRFMVGRFTAFNAWGTGSGGEVDGASAQVNRAFPKVNGTIYEVVPDGSGGWWIGGAFSCVGGDAGDDGDCTDAGEFTRQNLAHLNADGSVDADFANPRIEGDVTAIAAGAGVVYAGGRFDWVGWDGTARYARSGAAAFDAQGDVTTWNPNITEHSHEHTQVKDIEIAGSDVIVAGDFAKVGGVARRGIAKVTQGTGSLVAGWDAGLNEEVWDTVVVGSTVYMVGRFSKVNTTAARGAIGAVSVDTGAVDTAWVPDVAGNATSIATHGSSVWIAGGIGAVDGQTRHRVAELNMTDGRATAWTPGLRDVTMAEGFPQKIAVNASRVYVTGNMTMVDGEFRSRAAAFSRTTGALEPWDPNLGGEWSYAIAEQDGEVYIGGGFSSMGGTPRRGIAAFNDATGSVTPFAPALDNAAHGVGVIGDTVFVSGEFTRAQGVGGAIEARGKAAAFNASTGALTSWNPNPGANAWTMAVDEGRQTVFLGGDFDLGVPAGKTGNRRGVAAVSGSADCVASWTTACVRNWNPGIAASAGPLAVSGEHIFFSGHFDQVSGDTDHQRIAKVKVTEECLDNFTAASCVDSAWKPWIIGRGPTSAVSPDRCCVATITASGTRLFIGGFFEWLEDPADAAVRTARPYAAELNPSTGALQPWAPQMGGVVKSIVHDDATVYLSGSFSSIGGESRRLVGAVDASTAAVTPWNKQMVGTEVHKLVPTTGGVYAAGLFTSVEGAPNYNLARLVPATLTIATGGTGGGTVESDAGTSCGSLCFTSINLGRDVVLTAVPDEDSSFDGWSGACEGSDATCTVSMTQARAVTALFREGRDATDPPPGSGDGLPGAGSGAVVSPGAQEAARTSLLMPIVVKSSYSRSATRPTMALRRSLLIRHTGAYSFYLQAPDGKRIPMLKGSRIGTRTLGKGFYALRKSGSSGKPITLSMVVARPVPRGSVLRVILRDGGGSLHGVSFPVSSARAR